MRFTLSCLAVVLFASASAFAQSGTGELNGTVTDSSGTAVARATVTISNPATGLNRILKTNDGGVYSAPALTPGAYTIKVEQQGFQAQSRAGVEVQVGQAPSLNFTLNVGNVAEVIEVTGGAPVLETESTSVGTVIENKRIVELPRSMAATTCNWPR